MPFQHVLIALERRYSAPEMRKCQSTCGSLILAVGNGVIQNGSSLFLQAAVRPGSKGTSELHLDLDANNHCKVSF